jgi:RNA polymerase primary sigma factor
MGLVEPNLPFVFRIARQYRGLGLPFEDLVNEGSVGLIEASRRYDPGRGTKFSTYAVWWIRRSILKALSDQIKIVKVPEYQTRRLREVRETERTLHLSLGRAPGRDELSKRVHGGLRALQSADRIPLREVSLSAAMDGAGGLSIADTLVDRTAPSPEERLLRREARRQVRRALAALTEREQRVLFHRFGLGGGPCLSLLETGTALGMSRERVRQIQDRAVDRMRRSLLRRFVAAPARRAWPDPIVASAIASGKRKGDAASGAP